MNNRTGKIPADITEQAAAWLVRQDSGPLSVQEQAEFAAWLAEDELHRRAYADVEGVWDKAGKLPDSQPGTDVSLRRPASRGMHRWPLVLAASLAAVILGLWLDVPLRLQADVMTAVGERRVVSLPDGSRIILNTDSAVAYDMDQDRRGVRLLRGEALFEVVRDPQRPFTVAAAGGRTTVLGTRFNVRRHPRGAAVTVIEGRVAVTHPPAEGDASLQLNVNQQVSYTAGGGLGRARAVDTGQIIAWQRGRLHFIDRPLEEVVAELDRYHSGMILIVDKSLRRRSVNGVFSIDEPLAALAVVKQSLDLKALHLGDRLILLRSDR